VNAAGIIGLGAAAELIQYATYEQIQNLQRSLCNHLKFCGIDQFKDLEPIVMGFEPNYKIIAFRSIKYNPDDIAALLAQQNIAVRSGRMCAHDFVQSLSQSGILRISLAPYNSIDDCDKLISGLASALHSLS
jgi:selenocysteine lyase/cysteine desulfurase